MKLNWFYEQNPLWVVVILALAMILADEVGYQLGCRRSAKADEAAKDHFNAIRTSLLGLLALLLAFSFGMTAQRYDARRQLVIEDAIQLRALYLRTTVLADPRRAQLKRLLREYIDGRADTNLMQQVLTRRAAADLVARSEGIHARMWELVKSMGEQEALAGQAEELRKLLINVVSVHDKRVEAYLSRVPAPVIWLLMVSAVTTMMAVGFSGGLSRHRGMLARALFTLLVCATILVVLELDRPEQGLLQVDQSPMIRLKQTVDQEAGAGA